MAKLPNVKQEQFCKEFLIDLNAMRAYGRVYGVKPSNEGNANRLHHQPKVEARIKELMAVRESKTETKSLNVISELEKIAKAKMIDVFKIDAGGFLTIKHLDDIPEDCRSAIESIETVSLGGDKGVAMKIKFHSKIKALELLGRHFGLFNDRLEIGVKPKTIEDLIRSSKG